MVLTEVGFQGRVELRRHRARRTKRVVQGCLVRVPGHLCATHSAGYLNLATAAGAMAIHGHGGRTAVTVTRAWCGAVWCGVA